MNSKPIPIDSRAYANDRIEAFDAPVAASSPSKLRWTIFVLVVAASAALCIFYATEYRSGQQWARAKAAGIVQAAHAVTREDQIRAIQAFVRKNIHGDNLPVEGRPFLRSTAKDIVETGKGYCGEAARAFIVLAHQRGIPAQRINLHGSINHVLPEVELTPAKWVLVEIQDNPYTNKWFDAKWRSLDESIYSTEAPFTDYSNINLRRLPLVSRLVTRVKLENTFFSWTLENPPLMKSVVFGALAALLLIVAFADRLLIRHYSRRLGVEFIPRSRRD